MVTGFDEVFGSMKTYGRRQRLTYTYGIPTHGTDEA